MEPLKSIESCRAFLALHLKKTGGRGQLRQYDRALPVRALCRFLKLDVMDTYRYRDGVIPMPAKARRKLSRFIDLWESGYIEVVRTPTRGGRTKATLVLLKHPKNPQHVMKVTLKNGAPALSLERVARHSPLPSLSPFPVRLDM